MTAAGNWGICLVVVGGIHDLAAQCAQQQAVENRVDDQVDIVALIHQRHKAEAGIFIFQFRKALKAIEAPPTAEP